MAVRPPARGRPRGGGAAGGATASSPADCGRFERAKPARTRRIPRQSRRLHVNGYRYPTTGEGRLVAAGLMVAAIALLGVITASFASWLIERVRGLEQSESD